MSERELADLNERVARLLGWREERAGGGWFQTERREIRLLILPFYSSDWGATGELLDWLAANGHEPTLDYTDNRKCWIAVVRREHGAWAFDASTGPEALCRATIAAFEEGE